MPFFEFRCASCETTFEELLRTSSAKPAACPRCGHAEVQRLLSTFAVGASSPGSSASAGAACGRPGPGCGHCA